MTDDIYVYLTELPGCINEMVTPCAGGYTIYIDERLSDQGRIEAYMHAIGHIQRNDFDSGCSASSIERTAHGRK